MVLRVARRIVSLDFFIMLKFSSVFVNGFVIKRIRINIRVVVIGREILFMANKGLWDF